jgi:hypothetical protein
MDKVFVNDDIFPSDGDYVIGGFVATKADGYNLSDFQTQFSDRVSRLIDEYLERAMVYNQELGYEDPYEQAKFDLALVISDNLGLKAPFTDKETLAKTIIDSEQAQTWLLGIKSNIDDYEASFNSKYIGIYNNALEMDTTSTKYMNAKYFSEESTLESLIEQLSIIEL